MQELINLVEVVGGGIDPLPAVAIVLIAGFFMKQTQSLAIVTAGALGVYWVAYLGKSVVLEGQPIGTVIELTLEQFLGFKVSILLVHFLFFGMAILTIFTVKTVLQR